MQEMGITNQDVAKQVEARAAALLAGVEEAPEELKPEFVKGCLDANERGDGVLFATLHGDDFLYNITPKDGEWNVWNGTVWEVDQKGLLAAAAVEECALEYERCAKDLFKGIDLDEVEDDKDLKGTWKARLAKKYRSRVDRLRGRDGVSKALHWSPVVRPSMVVRSEDLDRNPWLLPCKNGVIDLEKGTLVRGRRDDLMTKVLDVEYDPHADYSRWTQVLAEISDSEEEIPEFLKRSFGYAATGFSYEQYLWIFLGPGRNGKGILFNLIGEILRPWFHAINPAMLLEQRNPPSPSAASEHRHSLLNKRLIVGSETNRNSNIDAAAVKELTGEDEINCRPNFSAEINFYPTHTLMLRTNNLPRGLTDDFAMRERLLLLDFPFRFVDDVEAHRRKEPQFADMFRLKNKHLKEELRQKKPAILKWIVDGCRDWQRHGLNPPKSILESVDKLANREDYCGRFIEDCLERFPDSKDDVKLSCKDMYEVFKWWWGENEGVVDVKKMPAVKTVNKQLRNSGFVVEPQGGITWVFGCAVKLEIDTLKKQDKPWR